MKINWKNSFAIFFPRLLERCKSMFRLIEMHDGMKIDEGCK